ncbi:sphingomyelin phosphodiesterase [Exophiala viscosa]|uniref:sphingomyelin phosphodiesterase n=1 Tax=Exophiala viscosa TaxID=2486360 RepID=UPI00218E7331|nr:sphingomyelin phosphodiesterase [Exophiala viscosa]
MPATSRFGSIFRSTLFMFLTSLGALLGYWMILKHTSLVAAFAPTLSNAQSPFIKPPVALNPNHTNIIASDVITLFYNGTGPVPDYDETSPIPPPITPFTESQIEDSLSSELLAINNTSFYPDNCSKCLAATQLLHVAAISQSVSVFTNVLIKACNVLPLIKSNIRASSCESEFSGVASFGPYLAQMFAKMSLTTGDMYTVCSIQYPLCEALPPMLIDESLYFDPKPETAEIAPEPSGETFDVLHLSDWHLDPRYDIGSEANCTGYLCCRPYSQNDNLLTYRSNASQPASRFGSFFCDSPADLALSAFSDMPDFVDMDELAFTIFTGDIVSHDAEDVLSQAYVAYEEEMTYLVFKKMLGKTPVYAALGNHDSLPTGYNLPHSMDIDPSNSSSNIHQWNYDLVSSLWSRHSWLNDSEAEFAKTHYGAYATTTAQGLRVISLNSDFWYKANIFNYVNVSNPDPSGILKWLADELSACERRGQRAWIIAHVLSGYDGSAPLPNPTALFYSIVRRFSPATIAAIFFGHTHQDQLQIFYDFLPSSLQTGSDTGKPSTLRDTTLVDFDSPLQVSYIGPSITPLTGLNSGYRVYQVDAKTFSVMGAQTYIANISNSLAWKKPVWEFEYDTRKEYANEVDGGEAGVDSNAVAGRGVPWPSTSPLNATFWHRVTEKMLTQSSTAFDQEYASPSLLDLYNTYESKSSSAKTRRGAGDISPVQKVCFIRAGSWALGTQCNKGLGNDARGERERAFGMV